MGEEGRGGDGKEVEALTLSSQFSPSYALLLMQDWKHGIV